MYYVLGIKDDSVYILNKVLKSIYNEWEDLAGVLKLTDHVGRIKYDHRGDSKASMRALLTFWMHGNGKTASHQSLLDALEEAGLTGDDIEQAIMAKVQEKVKLLKLDRRGLNQ